MCQQEPGCAEGNCVLCEARCVNLSSDPQNCGLCGHACEEDERCQGERCQPDCTRDELAESCQCQAFAEDICREPLREGICVWNGLNVEAPSCNDQCGEEWESCDASCESLSGSCQISERNGLFQDVVNNNARERECEAACQNYLDDLSVELRDGMRSLSDSPTNPYDFCCKFYPHNEGSKSPRGNCVIGIREEGREGDASWQFRCTFSND